jgi:hypothetical protein
MISQKNKFIVGATLMAICGVAILCWFYLSTKSGSILDSSPYLLVLTPFLFFIGLWLLGAANPEKKDSNFIKIIRRRMILLYLIVTLGLTSLILVFHVVSDKMPTPPGKSYAAVIIFLALISYALCYWLFIRKAEYRDKSPLLMPFFFLIGAILAPLDAVDIYNEFSQKIEILESVRDIEKAHSDFLHFKHLELDRERCLDGWWDRNNKTDVEYRGLLPVVTHPSDTLYRVWLYLQYFKSFDKTLSKSEHDKLRKEYSESSWKAIREFNPDSVVFFGKSSQEGKMVFETNDYPIPNSVIFLRPHRESFSSYKVEASGLYSKLGIYTFISLFFWLISTGKLDRKGYTWTSSSK